MDQQNKLSTKKWIVLIVLPFIALVVVAFLQVIVHFILSRNGSNASSSTGSLLLTLINIVSVLVGAFSIVAICLLPIWIIMLVKTINYNDATPDNRLNKTAAVIFAVVFGFWAWLYTYERDKTKFWINLGLVIITLSLWSVVAWVWSIIDMAIKPDEYFQRYPEFAG